MKGENDEKFDIKRLASYIFCIICGILAIYVLFKYLFPLFMPFLIAYLFALAVNPLANRMQKRFSMKKRHCAVFLTAFALLFAIFILSSIISTIINEGEKLIEFLARDGANIGVAIADFINKITSLGNSKIPLIESLMKIEQFRLFFDNIDTVIANAISSYVTSITKAIPSFLMNAVMKMPSILLFLIMTLVSSFYFALDFDRVNKTAISLLPKSIRKRIPEIKANILSTFAKYTRAYILLLFLTFIELLVGFSILKVEYPFLLAFSIALIDILPILGVGSALIPWAIFELIFMKNYFTGIGLLIIYAIVTIIRQVTEPKIIAGSLGLSPLATLISMYAGLKLFGIFGMIIGPALVLFFRSLFTKSQSRVDLKESI